MKRSKIIQITVGVYLPSPQHIVKVQRRRFGGYDSSATYWPTPSSWNRCRRVIDRIAAMSGEEVEERYA